MAARPHVASLLEDAWHRRLASTMTRRGWGTRVLAYTGYGSTERVRILGRVLMSRRPYRRMATHSGASWIELRNADRMRRGWRAFFTAPAMGEEVTIILGGASIVARADRSGIIDVELEGHGLPPGLHTARLTSPRAADAEAEIHVVDPAETFGLVSDIDDTVIATALPRPLIAAWNTFIKAEGTRRPVPGMATMYRELLRDHPGAPIVYVSTGAWNTVPLLTRFLRRNGYPLGPLLMTDWGPTNTGWFRSGQAHKEACLERLARELPEIDWILVGDDGQHDPSIYAEFTETHPDHVRAVCIRMLSPAEQILSHFAFGANEDIRRHHTRDIPLCKGSDGYALLSLMRRVIGTTKPPDPVLRSSW